MNFRSFLENPSMDTIDVAGYEKQSQLAGTLPAGWNNWNDMQKHIHVLHVMGQRKPTAQGSTVSYRPAPQQTQVRPTQNTGLVQKMKSFFRK